MQVKGKHYRTIWLKEGDDTIVQIINQELLPHRFVVEDLKSSAEVTDAIKNMQVRGAGLIGAAAGYGMYLAAKEATNHNNFDKYFFKIGDELKASRPTAVNLEWAVNRQLVAIEAGTTADEKVRIAKKTAIDIANEDSEYCKSIGQHGLSLIEEISKTRKGEPVNILTHCNAGWLAFTDFGSATSPIYQAFDKGINLHVWVDETRPRNQGSKLTAWELLNHGVPHTIIADNTGGHLMQTGKVDLVITGADRVTRTGDVANKIGTYLKALAANDNNIPFFVATPSSTIDWRLEDGLTEILIEERGEEEVKYIDGLKNNKLTRVLVAPTGSPAANYGFDITPSRLVTGLITERGICKADKEGLLKLFPEKKKANA